MKTTTVTKFRSKMKERLKEIEDNQDILIVSGPKKKDYVVLTLDQFNAMEETAHLMSTETNVTRLLESIAQDKTGIVTVKKLNLDGNTPAGSGRKKPIIKRKKNRI
jgi:antitoxin YefM